MILHHVQKGNYFTALMLIYEGMNSILTSWKRSANSMSSRTTLYSRAKYNKYFPRENTHLT